MVMPPKLFLQPAGFHLPRLGRVCLRLFVFRERFTMATSTEKLFSSTCITGLRYLNRIREVKPKRRCVPGLRHRGAQRSQR